MYLSDTFLAAGIESRRNTVAYASRCQRVGNIRRCVRGKAVLLLVALPHEYLLPSAASISCGLVVQAVYYFDGWRWSNENISMSPVSLLACLSCECNNLVWCIHLAAKLEICAPIAKWFRLLQPHTQHPTESIWTAFRGSLVPDYRTYYVSQNTRSQWLLL